MMENIQMDDYTLLVEREQVCLQDSNYNRRGAKNFSAGLD